MQTMQTMNSSLPEEIEVFAGTATELLKEVRTQCDEFLRRSSAHFPQTPQALSGRLNRMTPALREWGLKIAPSRVGRGSIRMINIMVATKMLNFLSSFDEEMHPEEEVEICDITKNTNSSTCQALPKISSASSAPSAPSAEISPKPQEQAKRRTIIVKRHRGLKRVN
jgi:hypothetical protein